MPSSNKKQWVVGDLVQLKSGGPVMTVKTVSSPEGSYTCQWFAGKKLEFGHFPGESLKDAKIEASQAPQ